MSYVGKIRELVGTPIFKYPWTNQTRELYKKSPRIHLRRSRTTQRFPETSSFWFGSKAVSFRASNARQVDRCRKTNLHSRSAPPDARQPIESKEIFVRQAESGSMTKKFTDLEQRGLTAALAGPEAWKQPLREQNPCLRVIAREYTDVGFFTKFACDECIPLTDQMANAALHQVPVAWGRHPDLFDGAPGTITFSVFL
jgi:hypothetical protein